MRGLRRQNKIPLTWAIQYRKVLEDKTERPLGGLVGVPLVNVLEVNLLLTERLK